MHLGEPFKTMAPLPLCLGLSVSELLALGWKDVDWMGSKLNVEHGIVNQLFDSRVRASMNLDLELLAVLYAWNSRRSSGRRRIGSSLKLRGLL